MENKFVEITKAEAKKIYCTCGKVYVSNNVRNFWKLPASSEYSSHAPAEELFYRSIPEYEGETRFFKLKA